MNVLAIDQARNGGWSVFDYEGKSLVGCGTFAFPSDKFTHEQTIVSICGVVIDLIEQYGIVAVFCEDIHLRQNVEVFKRLAQLQGGLIAAFESGEYLYDFVPPSVWQGYCRARGRTAKEIKAQRLEAETAGRKQSKLLSIQFVKENYGIETVDDNLADAICIGHWAINNVAIRPREKQE